MKGLPQRSGWIASVALAAFAPCVFAADPCGVSGWNLSREHALFDAKPAVVTAGRVASSAPQLAIDRLYRLNLSPQQDVQFAAPPEKKALTDGAFAGIARFRVPSAGTYRVAIDRPFWIDVVHDGTLLMPSDFTAERGCAPHKIVAYVLPAGELVLQVSGQVSPRVALSITRAAARARTL